MRVDFILSIVFGVEFFILTLLLLPCGQSIKKTIITSLYPFLVTYRLIIFIFWGIIGFIFAATFYESLQKPSQVTDGTVSTDLTS